MWAKGFLVPTLSTKSPPIPKKKPFFFSFHLPVGSSPTLNKNLVLIRLMSHISKSVTETSSDKLLGELKLKEISIGEQVNKRDEATYVRVTWKREKKEMKYKRERTSFVS